MKDEDEEEGQTGVIIETAFHVDTLDLFFKEIAFVEKEDDGGVSKPLTVADLVKEGDGFVHAVDTFVLVKLHVVLAEGDAEDEGRDILEAVDPLFALVSLATDVHHAPVHAAQLKRDFGDTRCSCTRPEQIVLRGRVIRLCNAINVVKEALQSCQSLFLFHS